jgi:hypothetical protein
MWRNWVEWLFPGKLRIEPISPLIGLRRLQWGKWLPRWVFQIWCNEFRFLLTKFVVVGIMVSNWISSYVAAIDPMSPHRWVCQWRGNLTAQKISSATERKATTTAELAEKEKWHSLMQMHDGFEISRWLIRKFLDLAARARPITT